MDDTKTALFHALWSPASSSSEGKSLDDSSESLRGCVNGGFTLLLWPDLWKMMIQ